MRTIGEVLAEGLTAAFEEQFPEHPEFSEPLELKHVSTLVNDLFSGARTSNGEAQKLAEAFAKPLGLVYEKGGLYLLEKEDAVFNLPFVARILTLLSESAGETVSLHKVFHALKESPFGFVREAQQLVLSALVAHRKAEFVTTKGDRINRRSLDLKIIWDDIAGIAKPAGVQYQVERLKLWAQNLTRLEDLVSIDAPDDRIRIKEGLAAWLSDWEDANIVNRFANLQDEILNTKIWNVSVNVERGFGNVAESIRALNEDTISLEECLVRIADSFSDSDKEFKVREAELVALISFIKSASLRDSIWGYLSIAEITKDSQIEELRVNLLELMETGSRAPNAQTNKQIGEVWKEFQSSFAEHFAVKHDSIMKSHQLQEKFDEFTKSDAWWEFERLSALPILQDVYWKEAQKILKHLRELDCSFDVRQHLKNHPFCACSFNLSKIEEWEDLPERLEEIVERGRLSYKKTFKLLSKDLKRRLEQFVKDDRDPEFVKSATDLIDLLAEDQEIDAFTTNQLSIIQKIFSDGLPSPMVSLRLPDKSGIQSAEVLRAGLNEWLNDLPAEPAVVKID